MKKKNSWASEDNYGNFIQLNFSFKRTYNCSDISFLTTLSLSQYKLRAYQIIRSPFSLLFIKTSSNWKIQSPQSPSWVLLVLQFSSWGEGARAKGTREFQSGGTWYPMTNKCHLVQKTVWDPGDMSGIKCVPWHIFWMCCEFLMLMLFLSNCCNAKAVICVHKIPLKNFLHFSQIKWIRLIYLSGLIPSLFKAQSRGGDNQPVTITISFKHRSYNYNWHPLPLNWRLLKNQLESLVWGYFSPFLITYHNC